MSSNSYLRCEGIQIAGVYGSMTMEISLIPLAARKNILVCPVLPKIILTILLAVTTSNAIAEWVAVGINDGGDIYADPSTILNDGNRVTIWTLIDYKMPRAFGRLKPLMSMKVQTEFDCKEKQTRDLTFFAYSGNMGSGEGENMAGAGIAYIDASPKNWTPVPPNGTGPALWKFACGKQ